MSTIQDATVVASRSPVREARRPTVRGVSAPATHSALISKEQTAQLLNDIHAITGKAIGIDDPIVTIYLAHLRAMDAMASEHRRLLEEAKTNVQAALNKHIDRLHTSLSAAGQANVTVLQNAFHELIEGSDAFAHLEYSVLTTSDNFVANLDERLRWMQTQSANVVANLRSITVILYVFVAMLFAVLSVFAARNAGWL